MSRKLKKAPSKRAVTAPGSAKPGDAGKKAFHSGAYTEAIRLWTPLEQEPKARAAIAEAHFRRALAPERSALEREIDLRRAVELAPNDARYQYQLGLALHRADRIDEGREAYARSFELGVSTPGAGYARALAELEADPWADIGSFPWLSDDPRAALAPISHLLLSDPMSVGSDVGRRAPPASGEIDPMASLWRGLALLATGDANAARAALAPVAGRRLPRGAEAARIFYHGVATLLSGHESAAFEIWNEAARTDARTRNPDLDKYRERLGALYLRHVAELQLAGAWAASIDVARNGLVFAPAELSLRRAWLRAESRLAETAKSAGNWEEVRERLFETIQPLREDRRIGSLTAVYHNLALANEALEEWDDAALAWTDMLDTIPAPRGKAAANSTRAERAEGDRRRAWVRRRILRMYQNAGRPEEAIAHFKRAIKADPDDIDLRLNYASALLANDQSIAARNEVQRIIGQHPESIEALMMLATIHEDREEFYEAEQALRRVLVIDPKHVTATGAIVSMIVQRGMSLFNDGRLDAARAVYIEALRYTPDDDRLLIFLGETEVRLRQNKSGLAHIDAALATGRPEAYLRAFKMWLRCGNEQYARDIVKRAETAGLATPEAYAGFGRAAFDHAGPRSQRVGSSASRQAMWERLGRELIRRGEEMAPDTGEYLKTLIRETPPEIWEYMLEYGRRLIELWPDAADAHLTYAMQQALDGDLAGARSTLRQAERAARKAGAEDIIERVREFRRMIDDPMFAQMLPLIQSGEIPFDTDADYR